MKFTEEQQELIEVSEAGIPRIGSVSVTADAGSGKTSTLVARVRNFIALNPALFESNQRKILCVSFTERSAADLSDRLNELVDCEVYTIHGFCARVVSEYSSLLNLSPVMEIIDADREQNLFYECFKSVYKKNPLPTEEHGPDTYYKIAKEFKNKRFPIESVSLDQKRVQSFVDDVFALYTERKSKAGVIEYSDLENFAARILSDPKFSALFKSRYAHVFVDEFQDTNELQCSLVRNLISKDSYLFVVGDEKQSIYRFRGADVEVFKEFSKTLPHQKRLSKNFRSDPEVIALVNRVCAPIIEDYSPMIEARADTATVYDKTIRVVAESNAEGIASIVGYLEKNGVERSKVVLLLKRISGNAELFQELKDLGVALSFSGTSSGKPDDDMLSLIHLWIWACLPKAELFAASVMHRFSDVFLKYFGVSASEDIHMRFEEWLARSGEAIGERSPHTCESLFDLLERKFSLTERFGMKALELRLFILKHQSRGMTPEKLALAMLRSLEDEGKIAELTALPPPPELKGSIRVMTVHSSKGLEFEHVILADLQSKGPRGGPLISSRGKTYFAGRDDDGKLLKTDDFKHAETVEYEMERKESARLLYVAMTRAEKGLYAVSDLPKKEGKEPDPDSWEAWLAPGFKKTMSASSLFETGSADARSSSEAATIVRPTPLLPESPRYIEARLGVTALLEKNNVDEFSIKRNEEKVLKVSAVENGYRFSRIGTEAHRLIQFEAWDELRKFLKKEDFEIDAFEKWLDSSLNSDFVSRAFESKNFKADEARVFREFAFDWKMKDGAIVAGRIDRLVLLNASDEAWIIDYKLVFSKKSETDFQNAYRDQLNVYRDAVQRLTKRKVVRTFLIDVLAKTGKILHEIRQS